MNNINLYTSEGWLNMPSLDAIPGIWLIVIVGARQIGKTYGLLKMLMKEKEGQFIYMRRTKEEVELICQNPDLSPFTPLTQEGLAPECEKVGKTYVIGNHPENEEYNQKGIILPLSGIAKMRGFSGAQYDNLFFDEFIPEKTVIKRKGEGDALLNAYTTINGNRELLGKPPLKLWLAANAFDQENSILEKLGLINILARMEKRKEEYTVVNDTCLVIRPLSNKITEAHENTAMNAFLKKQGSAEEYLGMAVNNVFSYDATYMVRPRSIAGHKPLCGLGGKVFVYTNGSSLYVCRSGHRKRVYGESQTDKIKCQLEFPVLRGLYNSNLVSFSDAETLLYFKRYLSLDK